MHGCAPAKDTTRRWGQWRGIWPKLPSTCSAGSKLIEIRLPQRVGPARCKRESVMSLWLAGGMRHTSGICSCPKQGEEMNGKDPLDCPEFGFDRRAFRDDRISRFMSELPSTTRGKEAPDAQKLSSAAKAGFGEWPYVGAEAPTP